MFNRLNRQNRFPKWALGPALILLIGIALLTSTQTALAWYRELVVAWTLPLDLGGTHDIAWGDYDSDGDIDILAVGGDALTIYANESDTFTEVWSEGSYYDRSGAWGDWDGDGDLDLAFGAEGYRPPLGGYVALPNTVYVNDDGSFSLAWTSPESEKTGSVAWGDMNGDGLADLAVGNDGAPNRVPDPAG